MARIRTIKPEFFTSEDICSMSPLGRLFYQACWCEADREGRMEWKPRTMKLRYFPADDCSIEDIAQEVVSRGLVSLYEIDGKFYALIPSFNRHQHVNPREAASTIPAPDASEREKQDTPRVSDTASTRADASNLDEHTQVGKERKGKEEESKQPREEVLPVAPEPSPQRPTPAKAEPTMPCRNDPPAKWIALAGKAEVDTDGVTKPVVGGFYLNVAADLVCEAAKIHSVSWRGDWRPLKAWLEEGFDLNEQILPEIKKISARPNYVAPGSLKYFDQAVRNAKRAA
jgi:hypothetical protein